LVAFITQFHYAKQLSLYHNEIFRTDWLSGYPAWQLLLKVIRIHTAKWLQKLLSVYEQWAQLACYNIGMVDPGRTIGIHKREVMVMQIPHK
jgi:hypothetical protein